MDEKKNKWKIMFFSFILSSVSKIISEKNLNKISPNKICFVKMDFNFKKFPLATGYPTQP